MDPTSLVRPSSTPELGLCRVTGHGQPSFLQPNTGNLAPGQLLTPPLLHHTRRHRGTLHRHRSGPMGPGSPSSAFHAGYRSSTSPTSFHSRSPSRTHTHASQVSPIAPSSTASPATARHHPVHPSPAARHSNARTPSQPVLPLSARQLPLCRFSGWSPPLHTGHRMFGPARHAGRPPHCLQAATPPPAGRLPGLPYPFSGCPLGGGVPCHVSSGFSTASRTASPHVVPDRGA